MATSLKKAIAHLPHHRIRAGAIKYIIIHCSGYTPQKQLEILDRLELSAHYIIGRNGKIYEVVPPELTAFHAGVSRWRGSAEKSLNDNSIGIELESASLGQDPQDYTPALCRSLYKLIAELMQTFNISKENILGHSDIAPTRKPDPGCGFPWAKLAKRGLAVNCGRKLCKKDLTEAEMLSAIGYDTENIAAARYAFCRRFDAEEISVERDIETLLSTPYPENFYPQDEKRYIRRLRAACRSFKDAVKK